MCVGLKHNMNSTLCHQRSMFCTPVHHLHLHTVTLFVMKHTSHIWQYLYYLTAHEVLVTSEGLGNIKTFRQQHILVKLHTFLLVSLQTVPTANSQVLIFLIQFVFVNMTLRY